MGTKRVWHPPAIAMKPRRQARCDWYGYEYRYVHEYEYTSNDCTHCEHLVLVTASMKTVRQPIEAENASDDDRKN